MGGREREQSQIYFLLHIQCSLLLYSSLSLSLLFLPRAIQGRGALRTTNWLGLHVVAAFFFISDLTATPDLCSSRAYLCCCSPCCRGHVLPLSHFMPKVSLSPSPSRQLPSPPHFSFSEVLHQAFNLPASLPPPPFFLLPRPT